METPLPRTSLLANLLATGALFAVVGSSLYSYARGGLVAVLFDDVLTADQKLDALQACFLAWGAWAPVVYVMFVATEVVVAPLPGLMLYAPGGIIFGGFFGGLYALLGNLLGAAIACQVMRLIGSKLFSEDTRFSLGRLEALLDRRGIWVIFFLRINPFTSSDLISYAAGLTRMPTWKVVLGTALGMAPLCWLQAYLAEDLMEAFPGLVYPLLVACLVYVVIVVVVLRQTLRSASAARAA